MALASQTPGPGFTIAWPPGQNLRLERTTDLQSWQPVPGAVSPWRIYFDAAPGAYFRAAPAPP